MQAGQTKAGASVEVEESLLFENVMGTRVLRDKGCVSFADEAGHIGDSFKALVGKFPFVEGVKEGTQKEGRFCLAACMRDQHTPNS